MPTGLWIVSEWRITTLRPHFSGVRGDLLNSGMSRTFDTFLHTDFVLRPAAATSGRSR